MVNSYIIEHTTLIYTKKHLIRINCIPDTASVRTHRAE